MSDTPNQAPEDILDELLNSKGSSDVPSPESPGHSEKAEPQEAPSKPERRNAPVFGYLAILFAVAFFMLLLAYFMQQRNTEVAMSGLRDSISQFQTVDELKDENEALREKIEALETELKEANTAQLTLEASVDAKETSLRGAYEFLLLETMLREEQYKDAAALCIAIKESDYINADFTVSNHAITFNTKTRWDEVSAQLIELGYLSRGEDGTLSVVGTPDTAE